jgi:hypothetical protein
MILERTVINNGYGCSCCMENDEYAEWIQENTMISLEQLVDEFFEQRKDICQSHLITYCYEKDGIIVYGYKYKDIYKKGETIEFIINNRSFIICDDGKKYKMNKAEILKKIKELQD